MKVVAVSISEKTGIKKGNVPVVNLKPNLGVEGDAHSGDWHRQVSFLGIESIDKMRGLGIEVNPGDFAENVTTMGVDLLSMKIGDRVKVGPDAVLEMTQIGKECHSGCAIMKAVGKCVMPTEGVFFKVITPGEVRPDDEIVILH